MRFIAHRGMNRQALENTLPAFELAFGVADGIELDVQLARCGTPICFHDDDLHAVFGVDLKVEDLDADELRRLVPSPRPGFDLPYDGWMPSQEERIPTLEQVLAAAPDGFFVNIEIKAPEVRRRTSTAAVADLVRRYPGNYLLSSFNPVELVRFARRGTGVPLALLFAPDSGFFLRRASATRLLLPMGLRALHPSWRLVTSDLVEVAHERGLDVNVWTVNDPRRVRWLDREGVDAIISDRPVEMRESAG